MWRLLCALFCFVMLLPASFSQNLRLEKVNAENFPELQVFIHDRNPESTDNANVECIIYCDEVWTAMDTSSAALHTRLANVARATMPWNSVDGSYGLFSLASIRVIRAPATLRFH